MKIRCRYTGELAPGEWIFGEDYTLDEIKDICPACGALKEEQCRFINELDECEEVGRFMHLDRIELDEE